MKRNIFSTVAVAALLFSACSEIDKQPQQNSGKDISFSIDITQDWRGEQEGTRAMIRKQPIHTVQLKADNGMELWLKGVTTNGIKEAKPGCNDVEATRGKPVDDIIGMGDFSSFSFTTDGNPYYLNVSCDRSGTLSQKIEWPENEQLKFYAIHPYDAYYIWPSPSGISFDFTVNSDVAKQKDLMYAVTEDLDYHINQKAPLHFVHALTAVNFVMGDVSFFAHLKEIKLTNVYTQGTYTLPTGATTSTGETAKGTWSNLATLEHHKIDMEEHDIDISTADKNTVITNEHRTFLMIPQKLDVEGDEVGVEIILDVHGQLITLHGTLTGEWEPGTTRTYIINSTKDISQYVLTGPQDIEIKYNDGNVDFDIVSDFIESDGSLRSVEWDLTVEYNDEGGWLNLPTGGTETQTVNVPVSSSSIENKKETRDNALKNATPKTDYDLSLYDSKGVLWPEGRNTANCYLISAPGTYKIPLVHGNAIKNGENNPSSYTSELEPYTTILNPFFDYKDRGITGPWLNHMGDVPTSGELLWSDINDNVVTNIAVDGDYLTFEVPQANLTEHGNAVVAVKDADGVIMWSWHLWFTTPDALETIECTNKEGRKFYFTKENVGFKYSKWMGSSFDNDRIATITITQKEAKEGEEPMSTTFTITQKVGRDIEFSSNLYQVGRKDPFSGRSEDSEKISVVYYAYSDPEVGATYGMSIQNPTTYYRKSTDERYPHVYHNWGPVVYRNAWSSNMDRSPDLNVPIVKTVYDPSPAGFSIPAYEAFSGFFLRQFEGIGGDRKLHDITKSMDLLHWTPGEILSQYQTKLNVSSFFEFGWRFHAYGKKGATAEERLASPTVFFPTTGYMDLNGNKTVINYSTTNEVRGYYWLGNPWRESREFQTNNFFWFAFLKARQDPREMHLTYTNYSYGYAVRPIREQQ